MRKELSLGEHKALAKNILATRSQLATIVRERPNSDKTARAALRVKNAIDILRNKLDGEYHKIIDNEQFKKLGHIYYKGEGE